MDVSCVFGPFLLDKVKTGEAFAGCCAKLQVKLEWKHTRGYLLSLEIAFLKGVSFYYCHHASMYLSASVFVCVCVWLCGVWRVPADTHSHPEEGRRERGG